MNMFASSIPTVLVSILWKNEASPSGWAEVARILHVVMSVINPVYALPGIMVVAGLEPLSTSSVSDYFQSWCAVPLYGSIMSVFIYGLNIMWQDSQSYYTTPGDLVQYGSSRKDEDVLAEE